MDKINIQPKVLLSIYLVLALASSILLVDKLLLGQALKGALPTDPNDFALFTAIFTLPHIIASFFSFFDKEYISNYGKKILRGSQYAGVAIIGISLVSTNLLLLVFAMYTMMHVFLQQSGIAKSLTRCSNTRTFNLWQWSGVAVSSMLYMSVYSNGFEPNTIYSIGVIVGLVIFIATAVNLLLSIQKSVGYYYLAATTALPVITSIFILFDYSILALAVPRIIHDITAYLFYASHDHNRYIDSPTNYLYSTIVRIVKLPVVIISPLLSITIAFLIQNLSPVGSFVVFLIFISIVHYYIEGFIWKSGSTHRRYINFSF